MSVETDKAAFEITRELICCDVFERLSPKGMVHWNDEEHREYRSHSICYWGAAAREIVREVGRGER